jgi:hypothetical protein
LINAKEKDLYLSNISPLGIPFNTLRGTTNEMFQQKRISDGVPGSACPKRFLALSKEFGSKGICTSSMKYQDAKLKELIEQKDTMSASAFEQIKFKITEKACLCVGLANSSYLENGIKITGQAQGVIICPGPNLAYFDEEVSLFRMVQHIYGKTTVIKVTDRPNMFIKELKMYVDYLKNDILEITEEVTVPQIKKLQSFRSNLMDGIAYYQTLFSNSAFLETTVKNIQKQLTCYQTELIDIKIPELVNT